MPPSYEDFLASRNGRRGLRCKRSLPAADGTCPLQYGANQPEYDLVAVDGDRTLKVSVKGSKDGGWGLTQLHTPNARTTMARLMRG